MARSVSMLARTFLATLLTTVVSSCGDSSPTRPTEANENGVVFVAGSVRDLRTNAVIGGARVSVGAAFDAAAAPVATATTAPDGTYTLTVPPGEYRVSIDDESTGIVRLRIPVYRGDFFARTTGCIARYGTVVDQQSRRFIAGATVSVGGGTATTDASGWFAVFLGCGGQPCIGFNTTFATISHPDYKTAEVIAGRGVCFAQRVDYELEKR